MFDSFPLCFPMSLLEFLLLRLTAYGWTFLEPFFLQRAMCTDALLFSPISRHLSSTIDVLLHLVSPGPFYLCPSYPLTCFLISVYRLLSRGNVCFELELFHNDFGRLPWLRPVIAFLRSRPCLFWTSSPQETQSTRDDGCCADFVLPENQPWRPSGRLNSHYTRPLR
mgnify:CR=1 FL=1